MMAVASATEVDAAALGRFLDGEWADIRELARSRLRSELVTPTYQLDAEAHRRQVHRQLKELATTPVATLGFPARFGGGDDVGSWVTGFATLAFSDLSLLVKCGVQWGLFAGAVLHLGTDHHHRTYLERILSMELPGSFAMTETGHGSDVQSIVTTATYDPRKEEFVVHTPTTSARKDYIGGAARDGRLAVVFAQLVSAGERHGVHAFLVPIRTSHGKPRAGVTIEDCGAKGGLHGVDNGRLAFDRVRIPREALLNRYADVAPDGTYTSPIKNESKRFFTMLGTLIQGRVSVAAGAASATKLALTIAVRYADTRRQFSAPNASEEVLLLDYRQHQRRLLPALATTYALHFAQDELVAALHDIIGKGEGNEQQRRELESRAAGLKAITTWHATATIQECREACGGAGYMAENQLTGLKADTDVFTTFEGDNTVLLQLVAKGLLTGYRDQFGDLDSRQLVRLVTSQVIESVLEATSVHQLGQRFVDVRPGKDQADLRDRGYQLDLLRWREKHVLAGLGRRMRSGLDGKREPFEVFNDAQDHVLLAARVHVDRIVFEAFAAAVERCDDLGVRQLLDLVCDLHVLSLLERDRAWFLEHDRFSPGRAKAVTRQVNELCAELRPYARRLVDAFGIPEACITAPIVREP